MRIWEVFVYGREGLDERRISIKNYNMTKAATERMSRGMGDGEIQRSMRASNKVGRSKDCRARDENDAEKISERNCVTKRER